MIFIGDNEGIWNVVQKPAIYGTETAQGKLYSNGSKLYTMDYSASKIWNINPDCRLQFPPHITLEKVDSWHQVFWNETQVAVAKPIFSLKPRSFTTTVFDTTSGLQLNQNKGNSLFPEAWYGHQLLMRVRDENERRRSDLFAWDIFNRPAPKKIFSLNANVDEIACNNKHIYCLNHKAPYSFSQLDLVQSCRHNLDFKSNGANIRNFGVSGNDEIYFTQQRSFKLLDSSNVELIADIELPIRPTGLAFQSPLIACFEECRFLIYDIRNCAKPVIANNYLTWKRQIRGTFNLERMISTLIGHDPYSDIKIKSIAFHQGSLFVGKGDHSIDRFDLTAEQTSLFDYLMF